VLWRIPHGFTPDVTTARQRPCWIGDFARSPDVSGGTNLEMGLSLPLT
jgi:hypothetical protein